MMSGDLKGEVKKLKVCSEKVFERNSRQSILIYHCLTTKAVLCKIKRLTLKSFISFATIQSGSYLHLKEVTPMNRRIFHTALNHHINTPKASYASCVCGHFSSVMKSIVMYSHRCSDLGCKDALGFSLCF